MICYTSTKDNMKYVNITPTSESVELRNNKVISLFSGAGGLDVGLEMAGFNTAVCVEIDPDCRETLRWNRPEWTLSEDDTNRIAGDIRDVKVSELLKLGKLKKGEAALVVGGAPCQPFSNIGKKKGQNDPVNGDLFLEFVRIVKGSLPKAFVFENVAGIAQAKHSEVISHMKQQFDKIGYSTTYAIINAADYGVPQKRERFFMIGLRGDTTPAFPFPTHSKNTKSWELLIATLSTQPKHKPSQWVTLQKTFKELPKSYRNRNDFAEMNISPVVVERMKLIQPGENFKALPMEMRPDCWRSGKHQGHDTFGRLSLNEPSVTIRTSAYNPSKGRYIHPTENRGLNSIEMAAIQTFPATWHFKCVGKTKVTLVSAGKQIGNAVPPILAKAIGLAVKTQLMELKLL